MTSTAIQTSGKRAPVLAWLIFLNCILYEFFLLLPLRLIYSGKLAQPQVALVVALIGTI